MLEVFALLIFFFVTLSIGRRLLALFKLSVTLLEEFLLSLALGAGFLMYFTSLLAVLHLLYKEVYILLAAVTVVLFFRDIGYLWRLTTLLVKSLRKKLRLNLPGLLLLAYLFFIAANLLPAFAPVSEFDSMAYHLAFAKTYASAHGFVYQPTQIYTTLPQAMTMLYAISELFFVSNLSNLIAYSFGIAASLAIYALVRRDYSESAALMASLLFFTMPIVIQLLPQTAVDISLTYFFLAAVTVFFKYAREKEESARTRMLVLFSVLLGIVGAIKMTGLFATAAFFAGMVLSWVLYKRGFSLKHAVLFGAITLLLVSPWLVMGYTYTGNPFYPQAYSTFGGRYLDASLSNLYANYDKLIGYDKGIISTLLIYWNITFNSRMFDTIIGITPFFIMILPLVFLFYRQVRDVREWSIMFFMSTIILLLVFLVTAPAMRYAFPALGLMSVMTASVLGAMMSGKAFKVTICLLLAASLVFNAAVWYGINAKNVRYLLSDETESEYYAKLKDHNTYDAASWINANTEQDSVVMLFNEPRGYFLDRQYIMSSPYQTYIDYNSMNGTADLLRRLKELDVSYVLINDGFFDTYSHSIKGSEKANTLLRGLMKEHGALMYEKNQIAVYKI